MKAAGPLQSLPIPT
jgi:hypothetical protein